MNAPILDTHRTVKRLMEAGFSSAQAETVTDVLSETRTSDLSELATKADVAVVKADLAAVRAELKADIAAVRTELKADLAAVEAALKFDIHSVETSLRADIKTLEATMTARIADNSRTQMQWTIGMFIAQLAFVVVLVKYLPGH